MALQGLRVEGGVIDAAYRGEIKLLLFNRNERTIIVAYRGDYVVQMVIHKIYEGIFKEVQELKETTRGEQGFGSTNAVILKKEITETKHEQQKTDKHGYKIGVKTTEEQKQLIKELMQEFEDIIAVNF
jgi:hypothetical protein